MVEDINKARSEARDAAFWSSEFPSMLNQLEKNADKIDRVLGSNKGIASLIFRGMRKVMMSGNPIQLQFLGYHLSLMCMELDLTQKKKEGEGRIIIPNFNGTGFRA